ncbi:hypothetical protein HF086_015271 [Spodoptera exigua]|uniref:Cryptochrome-1 n=1 Tax=Spodoptera exigua TaxID=7107 RepID=A0A922M7Y2_SPOEX|nr:hypothetical protein HF086_015271 [Spodoptera exigua]
MLGGSVLWFRHGLRLHDNPSLHSALEEKGFPFFPIFIFDGETAGIRKLCFEQDCEPVWRARDDSVKNACKEIGVVCKEHVSHTLWEPDTHTVATIGDPPRPVGEVDFTGVKFGSLPESFYNEFTVFDKTPKPEDLGVFLETEDIRMIRWVGGETTALKQMQQRLTVEYETFLSFYWSVQDLFRQVHQGRLTSNSASHFITGQLIWREYFYTMSVNNPNYGQMAGNPICLDIPWKTPSGDELQRSVCAGNWMWVSSSAFEALLDSGECACPVRLGQRLDPSGEYVRRYVPELARMPVEYIYEPWKAPIDVQERASCIIGKDYPDPVVNHLVAAQRNRNAMKWLSRSVAGRLQKDKWFDIVGELRHILQKAPPHCCPSSEDEIRQFMWLNE